MSKPLLVFSAPVDTRSGYGEHARDIFESILKMDKYDIKVISTRWGSTPRNVLKPDNPKHLDILQRIVNPNQITRQPDVWIQVTVPNEFQNYGKYNIGITAGIETTVCPHNWIEGVNRMNLIIVPSQFSKDVLEKTVFVQKDNYGNEINSIKCKTPIEVVFEGVDLSTYMETTNVESSVRRELTSIKEDFAFLFVGHWLPGDMGHDRKDVGMLIRVFCETFKNEQNPPALVLKTSGGVFSILDRETIMAKVRAIRKDVTGGICVPNVYVLHGELTDSEMNGLYNHTKIKAHISITKGEGFGRPLLEASLSGKPVIASNWSGHTDFLHKDYTILLGGSLVNVHQSAANDFLLKDSHWFYVDYNQVANALFSTFKNYKNIKAHCSNQKNYAQKFSLANSHKLYDEIFTKYIPSFPTIAQIKLPKLKKVD